MGTQVLGIVKSLGERKGEWGGPQWLQAIPASLSQALWLRSPEEMGGGGNICMDAFGVEGELPYPDLLTVRSSKPLSSLEVSFST